MKKFVLGMVTMAMLMVGGTVLAEEIESWIGKTVEGQFPITIDGKRIEQPGLVIEGTSYLPVRSSGELFGYEVSFVDSEVLLSKIEQPVQESVEIDVNELLSMEDKELIERYERNEMSIAALEDKIKMESSREISNQEYIDRTVNDVNRLKQENAEIKNIFSDRGINSSDDENEFSNMTDEQLRSSIERLQSSIDAKEEFVNSEQNRSNPNESAIQSFRESIEKEKEDLESRQAELERRETD